MLIQSLSNHEQIREKTTVKPDRHMTTFLALVWRPAGVLNKLSQRQASSDFMDTSYIDLQLSQVS